MKFKCVDRILKILPRRGRWHNRSEAKGVTEGYYPLERDSNSDTPPSHFVRHLPFQGRISISRIYSYWSYAIGLSLKGGDIT
jgi:hypothetical protein